MLVRAVLVCIVPAALDTAPVPVTWTVLASDVPAALRPGDSLALKVGAVINKGWYVYGMAQAAAGPTPLRITVPAGQVCALHGPVRGPRADRAWDALFETETTTHRGLVEFTVPLRVVPNPSAARTAIEIQVRYQACSDTLCLPPKTITLSTPLEIRRDAKALHIS